MDIEKRVSLWVSTFICQRNIWDTEVLNSIWQTKLRETASGVESVLKLIDEIGDITYTGKIDKRYQPLWETPQKLDILGMHSCQVYIKPPSKGNKFRRIVNYIYITPNGIVGQYVFFVFLVLLCILHKKKPIILSPQI